MRRGIATYRFLVPLALFVALGSWFATGYATPQPDALSCWCGVPPAAKTELTPPIQPELPPIPLPSVIAAQPAREARGLVLAPQDLPGAILANCRLVGDWGGRSLRGAHLSECDLSQAILDAGSGGGLPRYTPDLDVRGCTYDIFTRWPAGFDAKAAGAQLRVR